MSFWYVVHVMSGSEKSVVQSIRDKFIQNNIIDLLEDIIIPCEKYTQVKKGVKTINERKVFPGYILIKTQVNDQIWHIIRKIPKIFGFLGNGSIPQALTETEVNNMFNQLEQIKPSSYEINNNFDVGTKVRVASGPFVSFNGVVEEIYEDRARLKVSISIFGRLTPVDLDFSQVECL